MKTWMIAGALILYGVGNGTAATEQVQASESAKRSSVYLDKQGRPTIPTPAAAGGQAAAGTNANSQADRTPQPTPVVQHAPGGGEMVIMPPRTGHRAIVGITSEGRQKVRGERRP